MSVTTQTAVLSSLPNGTPISTTPGDGGLVQVVQGPLTDAQLRAVAVPVSGPLTDTQLRATPVPVSGTVATGGLTDTQLRAVAVPVSGPLTDTQLRASAVPVSGPLTDTQLRASAVAVSGPLTDAQIRAAPVPVSNASLPLPAGASTDASVLALDADLKAEIGVVGASPGAFTVLDRLNQIATKIDRAASTNATDATLKQVLAAIKATLPKPSSSTLLHR